jgi:DNA invertase Pin-like site-specific DNA recombinase
MSNPLTIAAEHKIRHDHQQRLAVVYVRQSTVHQVQHHQQSTQLQYGLVEHARRLGWPSEQVLVIDEDLGVSGASVEGRHGFQRLLSEVAFNHVGLILGVEMSRLARSCKDWYQLLELCALFRTLIADLDGLYDPTSYNDRLLLGLKGTMSEAELHILKQRMLQGALQKARRGELVSKVPIGYVRNATGEVQLDPDEQARCVVRLLFEQFGRLGSASAVLRWLVRHQVKLPVRQDTGPAKGSLEWRRPSLTTVRNLLTNPLYTGAYAYGRTCQNPTTRRVRNVSQRLRQDQWQVLLKDRYPAYITWEQFEQNGAQLAANQSAQESRGAVRVGRALLSGLLICGRCGFRMTTRYQGKASQPRYLCDRGRTLYGQSRCQSAAARVIDDEVVRLALLALAPASLDVSLAVAADVERQRGQLECHWQSRLERARYEVDRARRQYDAVEPENRLVARSLEQTWEERLRGLQQLEQECQRAKQAWSPLLSTTEREQIQRLSTDLPALWKAAQTTDAERKQILQQLIEQVSLNVEGDGEWVELRVRWAGGQQTYSRIRRPVAGTSQLSQWPELKDRLRTLKSSGLSSRQIADTLHAERFKPAKGARITAEVVRVWLSRYGLTTREAVGCDTATNEWTIPQLVDRYQLPVSTIYGWIRHGRVVARQITGPRSRWLLQATPEQLDLLIIQRRKRSSSADENGSEPISPVPQPVSRGVS